MGMSVLNALFSFIGGLGMFLFGMHIMSEGLQKSAGEKSRRFMRLFTDNRLLGVAVGALDCFVSAVPIPRPRQPSSTASSMISAMRAQ